MGFISNRKRKVFYYKNIERQFASEIVEIFKNHIEIRHIKGGESTRKRYLKLKEG